MTPPEAGAAAMGLGVLSVASDSAHLTGLSLLLFAAAVLVWLFLAVAFLHCWVRDRARWRVASRVPGALTAVAATGMLGMGVSLLGWVVAAETMLMLTVLLWSALLPRALHHIRVPTVGGSFLLCVATQSIAALAGQIALMTQSTGALIVCVVADLIGLALYALVLARFDFRQVVLGAGDHWVAGGALAISCVATGKLLAAMEALHIGLTMMTTVRVVDLVLLALTAGWYVALTTAELLAPRPRYNVRRWATVFPLGMLSTAGFTVGAAAGLGWLATAAQVLLWPALAVCCLTTYGAARRTLHHLRAA